MRFSRILAIAVLLGLTLVHALFIVFSTWRTGTVQFEYLCSSDVISLSRCFFRGSISISSGLRNSAVILSGDIHQNSTIVSNQATYSWSGECDPRIANAELIDGLPTNCNDLRDLRNGYSLANVILLASLAGCILLDFIIVFFKLRTDQPTRPPANNRVLAFFISLLKLLPLSCAVLPLAGTIISILILYGLDYSSNALYQYSVNYFITLGILESKNLPTEMKFSLGTNFYVQSTLIVLNAAFVYAFLLCLEASKISRLRKCVSNITIYKSVPSLVQMEDAMTRVNYSEVVL
mmetsp:Transcript_43695/g.71013  ORF Transcript_43695/g.71013 Transcript_43695/m.71013 type:complete len:292 (+) Transcript_43695:212-1087(+)